MLAAAVAAALLVFLGGQLAMRGARKVARSRTYRETRKRLGGSLSTRLPSFSKLSSIRRAAAVENGAGEESETHSRAEAGLAGAPPDPQELCAAVAAMAAQLQQVLAAQHAAADGAKVPDD